MGFFVAMCLVIYDMRERQRDSVEHIIAYYRAEGRSEKFGGFQGTLHFRRP